ncbi:MAG: hypothetical protein QM758_03675 [Armatimonas sp.]
MNGWTRAKGVPESARVSVFRQDPIKPSVVHLALSYSQGYMRSEDGGRSFAAPGAGMGRGVRDLALCPSQPARLYASVEGDSRVVMRSNDSGKTWQKAAMRGFAPSQRPHGIQLVVDPTDAARLFLLAMGTPEVLWRSGDSGETWTRMDRGLSGRPTFGTIVIAPMLAVTKGGVKLALLGGGRMARIGPGEDSWKDATPRAPKAEAEWVTIDPRHSSRLWRTGQGKLWRSDDGRRWSRVGTATDATLVTCDSGKAGRLLLARYSGIFLSGDSGKSWRQVADKEAQYAVFAGENLVSTDGQKVFWRKL